VAAGAQGVSHAAPAAAAAAGDAGCALSIKVTRTSLATHLKACWSSLLLTGGRRWAGGPTLELPAAATPCVSSCYAGLHAGQVDWSAPVCVQEFEFDHIFAPEATQEVGRPVHASQKLAPHCFSY
jgi:hypothetical protein